MKKRLGASLDALHSLTAETAVLAPVAVGVLLWLEVTRRDHVRGTDAPLHPLLLASSGVATAIPLLLFAAAARRVPLVTIGLLQFITPVLQLICGVLLLGEVMTTSRWVGFGIVWVALALLAVDSLWSARSRSRSRARDREPAPHATRRDLSLAAPGPPQRAARATLSGPGRRAGRPAASRAARAASSSWSTSQASRTPVVVATTVRASNGTGTLHVTPQVRETASTNPSTVAWKLSYRSRATEGPLSLRSDHVVSS